MLFPQVPDQVVEEPDIVYGHVGLKGITDVPARFAPAVALALRIADGESVAVGGFVHAESFGKSLSAVTVEDDDQRSVFRKPFGQVEAVGAFDAA